MELTLPHCIWTVSGTMLTTFPLWHGGAESTVYGHGEPFSALLGRIIWMDGRMDHAFPRSALVPMGCCSNKAMGHGWEIGHGVVSLSLMRDAVLTMIC
jgi:hypothetical protein